MLMISLSGEIRSVRENNPSWKSKSRIIGRAGEKFCSTKIKCFNCGESDWLECSVNQKSKDQICNQCNKQYQIKCKKVTEKSYKKIFKSIIFL